MFGREKGNFLVVVHTHWMGHKNWHSKVLVDATEKEAKGEAALWADELRGDFCRASGAAFLLPDTVIVQT